MSFNTFRASFLSAARNPLRRAVHVDKIAFRANFNRKYSTPPPSGSPKSSSTGLYIGFGAAAAAGGLAYYFYATTIGREAVTAVSSDVQAAKVKAHLVPTKEDYIKVEQFHKLVFILIIFRFTIELLISWMMLVNMMVRVFENILPNPYKLIGYRWFVWTCSSSSCLARIRNLR